MSHGCFDKFNDALTRSEARLIAGLTTPARIQKFLDSVQYGEDCFNSIIDTDWPQVKTRLENRLRRPFEKNRSSLRERSYR